MLCDAGGGDSSRATGASGVVWASSGAEGWEAEDDGDDDNDEADDEAEERRLGWACCHTGMLKKAVPCVGRLIARGDVRTI